MKKNKINLTNPLKALRNLPLKAIIITVLISSSLVFVAGYIWNVAKDSDYFKISDIAVIGNDVADLSYLKQRNIFSVNLKNESRFMLESYPEFRRVRLVKVLPNRIFVYFIKRKPVGLVKLYKYFAVDSEGVLFNLPAQPKSLGLPEVVGLETRIFGPKSGRKYNVRELALALNIIKEVKLNRLSEEHKIKKIDVAEPAAASIYLILSSRDSRGWQDQTERGCDYLEIKIGQEDIKDKIAILAGLMKQEKKSLFNIKYIDLRFKEPVIKLKGN